VVLASGNFIAVRYSNLELEPMWGAGLRFALAAALFGLLAVVARAKAPLGHDRTLTLLYGLVNFGVFYALMYWSLLHVTAGTATVVIASVPLLTLLLAAAQGLERLRGRAFIGAGLALAGIAWLTLGTSQFSGTPLALVTLVLAAAAIAQSIIFGKKIARHPPAVLNAIGMGVGAAVLLLLSLVAGERWVWPTLPEARWALLYLVTFGSVGLFGLTLLLIRRWLPSSSAYVMVVVPIVTLLLESAIAGVPITSVVVLGAVLVMVGAWFGALSGATQRGESPAPSSRGARH
jgi:drug/metabolite transporter (DMT)-like permease